MSPADEDDLALLAARASSGDETAARELVERLHPLLWRIVHAHLPRRTDAGDLIQEVLVKMFSRLHQYRGDSPFAHWVSRMAVTTCLDRLKHERRRPELRRADLSEDEAHAFEQVVTGTAQADALDAAVARELAEHLLDLLPPDDRALLRWLDLDGDSISEIAARMQLGESAVKMRASRARTKLRAEVEALRAKGLL
jgi:RNA polymerase sigma-70 factor (ECF subfamily)